MPMPAIAETIESNETVEINSSETANGQQDKTDTDDTDSIASITSDGPIESSEVEEQNGTANGIKPEGFKGAIALIPNGVGEHTIRPSSRVRLFKQMNNLKMSSVNINQVLPIEYPKDFQVIWRNVSYKVKTFQKNSWRLADYQILHNLNGHFSSGQVTAIMGPSGAGKSTLLEILACRRRLGLTGEVKLKDISKVRISFVPQNNHLAASLTIAETLLFAARLQNINNVGYNCQDRVDKLIAMFGLEPIRDTRIQRCSGGQHKRLSIALELFQSPNVLILDEPTTGLDSASCTLVMKLLKELVDNPEYPMAIVCTIHQPAWNMFTEIDHVYIMTKRGRCLYTGPPNKLLPLLSRENIVCDQFNSPSDFIIEIAAEDYGTEPIEQLQAHLDEGKSDGDELEVLPNLRDVRINRKVPFFPSFAILMQRSSLVYKRNLLVVFLRLISIVLITVWLQLMFGTEIGKVAGCTMRKAELYSTPVDKLSTLFEESILMVTQNSCCLFFGLMVGLISGMTSVVLEFPKEMHIFMKEYNNGWYSCFAFFLTKSLIDIPMQILMPSIYVVYIYEFTSQPRQFFREFYLLYITIMVGFVSESIGAICSAIFMDKPTAAAFAAGAVPLPMTLFGGFLVKYSRMPIYMQLASWFSLLKYAFEGIMVTMYGFNRCEFNYQEFLATVNESAVEKPLWARYLPMILNVLDTDGDDDGEGDDDQKVINKIYTITFQALNSDAKHVNLDRSLILSYYELDDDNILYVSIIAMTVYYVVMKVLTYFIILAKLNSSI